MLVRKVAILKDTVLTISDGVQLTLPYSFKSLEIIPDLLLFRLQKMVNAAAHKATKTDSTVTSRPDYCNTLR